MLSTRPIIPAGDPLIHGIVGYEKWAVQNLTFSFPADANLYEWNYGSGEVNGFVALNPAQIAAARAAFAQVSAISSLTFTEITETLTDRAFLRFAQSSVPETAWAYNPSDSAEGGDAWFGTKNGDFVAPVKGNYAYVTFLHELGHALGLDHAHEGPMMPSYRDTIEYTVMSYSSYEGASPYTGYTNETWGYAQSLMMYDIAALQQLYGANYNTQSSNTVYSWSATSGEMFIDGVGQGAPGDNRIFMTVWDGGGTDTYDFSNYTTRMTVDLRPGSWTGTSGSQIVDLNADGSKKAVGNIANALLHDNDTRSLVENAIGGSGNDSVTGNILDNILRGGAGDDSLRGMGGSDTLFGGDGWDSASFDFSLLDAKSAYRDGAIVIDHQGSANRLYGIESLAFSDRTVTQDDGNPLVDDLRYYSRYKDVYRANMEAEDHYLQHGWKEGRDPNAFFDTSEYLETYTDVAAAGINPLEHYARYGWKEGRDPSSRFDTTDYLRLNPDVAAAGLNPLAHYLAYGIYEGRKVDSGTALVDEAFYFKNYEDVAASNYDAEEHFAQFGWQEGRNPNAFFDTSDYLATYADVAAAGMNPLDHYKNYGWREGRDPSKIFDTAGYLELNPDVAAAGINPLEHYLSYGIHEGRSYLNDGIFG